MSLALRFQPLPDGWAFADGEVWVFCASRDQPEWRIKQLTSTLSTHERARMARFRLERDQNRFAVGRGILREILGRVVGLEPGHVVLCHGPGGKPRFAAPTAACGLQFNLAHSDAVAVYAVCRGRPVGVDVERVDGFEGLELVAAQFLSEHEGVRWQALPAQERTEAFFHFWTCKEAFLKATGKGLSVSPRQVEVTITPGEHPRLLGVNGRRNAGARWSFHSLAPAPGYLGALATEGTGPIRCWNWDTDDTPQSPQALAWNADRIREGAAVAEIW